MKKPIHGDELTIRYSGAMVRARCDEIVETPTRGAGAARFTIVSQTRFERGHEAHLLEGAKELSIQVERVTMMGHRKANIVSFFGIFDSPGMLKEAALTEHAR
jgi:hypothetical protein